MRPRTIHVRTFDGLSTTLVLPPSWALITAFTQGGHTTLIIETINDPSYDSYPVKFRLLPILSLSPSFTLPPGFEVCRPVMEEGRVRAILIANDPFDSPEEQALTPTHNPPHPTKLS